VLWSVFFSFISSSDLMLKEIQYWKEHRGEKITSPAIDTMSLKKEVAKLKEQENRFEKAYGAGFFTLEKLKEHADTIKEKIISLESQIAQARGVEAQFNSITFPEPHEVKAFAAKVSEKFQNLSFEQKRAIVMNSFEVLIGAPGRLHANGAIFITNYVKFFTDGRHRGAAQCRQVDALSGYYQKERFDCQLSFCDHRPLGGRCCSA